MSASSSRLEDSPSGIHAALERGTAGFASGSSDIVEFERAGSDGAIALGEASHGRVTIVGANELVVTSFRGPFDISIDGDTHSIGDGQSYRVQIVDAQDRAGERTARERFLRCETGKSYSFLSCCRQRRSAPGLADTHLPRAGRKPQPAEALIATASGGENTPYNL